MPAYSPDTARAWDEAKESVNPKELAKNIQSNVEAVLKDPTNVQALAALHKDSQLLDGKLSWGKDGSLVDHNANVQQSVQQELDNLEAKGTIPKITIAESGQISAEQNAREVLAGPNEPTVVWDIGGKKPEGTK